MSYPDAVLLARFDAAAIPAASWSHRCHVRVAYLVLRDSPHAEAVRRLREGIRRLDRAHGLVAGDTRGYHETLTLAWVRLVGTALASGAPARDSSAFLAAHPELLRREHVLEHYSPERLRLPRARHEFVLPDRAPLPPVAPAPALVGNPSGPGKDRAVLLTESTPRPDGRDPSRRTRT